MNLIERPARTATPSVLTPGSEPKADRAWFGRLRPWHLQLMALFVHRKIIAGNELYLAAAVCLGFLCRAFTLLSFALTLQALAAAINPDLMLRIANQISSKLGLGFNVGLTELITVIIAAIIGIHAMNWGISFLYADLLRQIKLRIANKPDNFQNKSIDDDMFMIEQTPPVLDGLVKILEITVFCMLILSVIAWFSPLLALLLIISMAILVAVQMYGDRSKVREWKIQTEARKYYYNELHKDGALRRRKQAEQIPERDAYLAILGLRSRKSITKPHADAFAGAIVLAVVIDYLFQANLSTYQLAGLLFVFVLGIRYVISMGREMSVNLGLILELRKYTQLLQRLLNCNPSSASSQYP